jgi:hypothetical protein
MPTCSHVPCSSSRSFSVLLNAMFETKSLSTARMSAHFIGKRKTADCRFDRHKGRKLYRCVQSETPTFCREIFVQCATAAITVYESTFRKADVMKPHRSARMSAFIVIFLVAAAIVPAQAANACFAAIRSILCMAAPTSRMVGRFAAMRSINACARPKRPTKNCARVIPKQSTHCH